MISVGEPSVLIGNAMAARIGDRTAGGGRVATGDSTVWIGHVSAKKCMLEAFRDAQALIVMERL